MYSLLMLNGGVGSRVGSKHPKQLIKIKGIPILIYSLVAADDIQEIDQIVLNYPNGYLSDIKALLEDYAIKTPVTLVEAGDSRHSSVRKLLEKANNESVIIHESARPLVTTHDFRRLISSAHENVSFMLPIPFTVAPVDPSTNTVTGSLIRDKLRNVQLPQKFNKSALERVHELTKSTGQEFTEDATLMAVNGETVHYIDGSDVNFKVTMPIDIQVASYLLHGRFSDE